MDCYLYVGLYRLDGRTLDYFDAIKYLLSSGFDNTEAKEYCHLLWQNRFK